MSKILLYSIIKSMKVFFMWLLLFPCIMFVSEAYSGTVSSRQALTPGEREILAGAEERIQKYRMATASLSVVTADGQPVSDAVVEIKQKGHEFLFGVNHSDSLWTAMAAKKYGIKSRKFNLRPELIEECIRSFMELGNYTSLPVGWQIYEPVRGEINYTMYDREIEYLHMNGFKVLAHHLIWNNYTPHWIPEDCDEIGRAVKKRVREFLSHYKGKFDFFLVFNEAANPFRPAFKKNRLSNCFREFGKTSFVSLPFNVCREIDPTAKLMINEVSIGAKQGFPDLLRDLKDSESKPLYDVIGIQTHMHKKLWRLDRVWEACEGYSTFGVPLHFTEVTVLSGTPMCGKNCGMTTTPEGERKQAEYSVNLYTTLFSHPSVEAIQWWNFTDLLAWKRVPAGLLRKDMTPKPAYTALLDLIKKKWWTRDQKKTSKHGTCQFKGFFGTYDITISYGQRQSRTFKIKLSKYGKRNFQLIL